MTSTKLSAKKAGHGHGSAIHTQPVWFVSLFDSGAKSVKQNQERKKENDLLKLPGTAQQRGFTALVACTAGWLAASYQLTHWRVS